MKLQELKYKLEHDSTFNDKLINYESINTIKTTNNVFKFKEIITKSNSIFNTETNNGSNM